MWNNGSQENINKIFINFIRNSIRINKWDDNNVSIKRKQWEGEKIKGYNASKSGTLEEQRVRKSVEQFRVT